MIALNFFPFLLTIVPEEDKTVLKQLFEEHHYMLYNFILKMVRDEEAAQDILQECFVRFIKCMENIKEKKSYKSYLFTIAMNICRDKGRRKKHAQQTSMDELKEKGYDLPDDHSNLEEHVALDFAEKAMEKIINTLPEKEKSILFMKKMEGMTYDKIAEITGYSERTLMRIVKATIQKIADSLEDMGIMQEGEIL